MNATYCKRGPKNRRPRRNHFLAALLVAATLMILTVPAFTAAMMVDTNEPDPESSNSMPDVTAFPDDEDDVLPDEADDPDDPDDPDPTTTPTSGPVSTAEDLLDAIANANENDVIYIDTPIKIGSEPELVFGRADCPVTIRRATSGAGIGFGYEVENIIVQNITFDGAGIETMIPLVIAGAPTQTFEKCNFINCAGKGSAALEINDGYTFLSDCYFANNRGSTGAHFRSDGRKATIENCTFTGGYAIDKACVFINTREESLMTGCTITGNTAGEQGGGGLYVGSAGLCIIGSKIYGNTSNGVADDIVKECSSRLSLMDDYAALVELYKSDGVIPNKWTVDSRFDMMDPYHADMVFSMTFVDNEPLLPSVPEPEPEPESLPTSITLDKSELILDVGETDTLTATLHPEGANGSVQWTSSNSSVASVSENGLITAHSAGITLITAKVADSELSASCAVNVQNVPDVQAILYSINISASPIEGGVVSGDGQYKAGATATVTAVPNEGFRFVAWTEADTQISTESSLTFSVSNDRNLTAIFEVIPPIPTPTYTIKVITTAGGSANGGGEYEQGSSVTLTATPESEYLFTGWTENGEQVSTNESFTFVADRDRTLVANFEPIPKSTYTIQVGSTQGGTVEGGGSYEEGAFVAVNAIPDSGYRFLRWEENDAEISTEARYTFTADANRTLVAVFSLIPQSTPDLTPGPSKDSGTQSTVHGTNRDTQPADTSTPPQNEVQTPTLTNGKAVLIAPDDLFWEGYKTGRNNGTETITRADLAQLVYSLMDNESKKLYGVTQSPFDDVKSGAWYEAAIGTMSKTGVMIGCGNGQFCPERTLTWGELLTVFARLTEDKPLTEYYTGNHWAKDAVNKAFTLGWLEYAEGFDPGSVVTTGEMVDLIQTVFR